MFGTDYPFLASIPYTLDPLRSHGLGAADLEAIEQRHRAPAVPALRQG